MPRPRTSRRSSMLTATAIIRQRRLATGPCSHHIRCARCSPAPTPRKMQKVQILPSAGPHCRPIRAEANRSKQGVLHAPATDLPNERYPQRTGCRSRARVERLRESTPSEDWLCRRALARPRGLRRSEDRAEGSWCFVLACDRGRGSRPCLDAAAAVPLYANVVVQRTPGKRMFAASELPSASLASRDILFPALVAGRNGAERGLLRRFFRTTRTGRQARFGRSSVSLRAISLTQPNHGDFGTDVGSSIIQ
jgi:hypothetical protein